MIKNQQILFICVLLAITFLSYSSDVTIQAENYSAQSGCSVATGNGGYTGTGYLDYGSWGEWILNNDGGSTTITITYANGSTGDRACNVFLNGNQIGSLAFGPTGSWTTWGTMNIAATLNPGNNTLKVQMISNGPNIDKIDYSASGSSPEPTTSPTSEPTTSPAPTPAVTASPTPTPAVTASPTTNPDPNGITLVYKCGITSDPSQSLRPWFIIKNNSGTTISLSDVKVRYYYTKEGIPAEQIATYYVAVGSSNINASFYPDLGYVEVGFTSGAGNISSGNTSGECQIGFQKVTNGHYIQSNDFSFDPSITNYSEYDKLPLYYQGSLLYGTEGPAPTPIPTLPPSGDDWLHVDVNCIKDTNGKVVRLTGINWFGYETVGAKGFYGLDQCSLEGSLDMMAARGFNLLRIPICVEMIKEWQSGIYVNTANVNTNVNPNLDGFNSLEILDYTINYLKKTGMKVMFDMHSPNRDGYTANLWYNSSFTEADLVSAWQWLIARYNGDDTIVAADVKNEPHGKYSGSGIAKWDNSNDSNNWRRAAEDIGDSILSINSNLLIMVEGIEAVPMEGYDYSNCGEFTTYTNWWGGNLRNAGVYPVNLSVTNRLVYSPHDYGPLVYAQPWFYSGFNQNTLYYDCWQPNWYYLVEQGVSPLLIGEWGGKMDGSINEIWLNALADFMVQENLHHTFWCFNPNSGDTGGLVDEDWNTVDEAKYAIVEPTLWQDNSGKYVGLDHEVVLGYSSTGTNIPAYYAGGGFAPVPPVAPPPTSSPTGDPTASPTPTNAPTVSPTSAPTAFPTPDPTASPTPDPTATPGGGGFTGDSESNPFNLPASNLYYVIDLSNGYCWLSFPNNIMGSQIDNNGSQFSLKIEDNSGTELMNFGLTWSHQGVSGKNLIKIIKLDGSDTVKYKWW